jgi:hypothetical protein
VYSGHRASSEQLRAVCFVQRLTKFNGGNQTFTRITLVPAKTFDQTWCTMVRDKEPVITSLTVIKIIVIFVYGL